MHPRAFPGAPMPVPTDVRLPLRGVLFQERNGGTEVRRDQVISAPEFLAIPNEEINRAIMSGRLKPLIVQLLDDDSPGEKQQPSERLALCLPDDRFAVVCGFEPSPEAVNTHVPFPMRSPRDRHIYLDPDQWEAALAHRAYKSALLGWMAQGAPSGTRPMPPPDPYGRLMREMERGRFQV